jgi:hypothetical protein
MAAEEEQDTVFATAAHAAAFAGNTVALIALAEEDPTLLRSKTEDGETPAYVHCKDVLRACLSATVASVCRRDGCTCVPLILVTRVDTMLQLLVRPSLSRVWGASTSPSSWKLTLRAGACTVRRRPCACSGTACARFTFVCALPRAASL